MGLWSVAKLVATNAHETKDLRSNPATAPTKSEEPIDREKIQSNIFIKIYFPPIIFVLRSDLSIFPQ